MSYPEATGAPVTVHRAADPPDIAGPPTLRFVAPGSVTAGRYGLFEYRIAGAQPRAGPALPPHVLGVVLRAVRRADDLRRAALGGLRAG